MAQMRLQKALSQAGVASRRHCEEIIAAGRVTVDGVAVTRMGLKVDPDAQEICVDGQRVRKLERVYFLLNKSRGTVCTCDDPQGRPLAVDLIQGAPPGIFTVGRLDSETEGLIVVTNDGGLAHHMAHPSFGMTKVYHARVRGVVDKASLEAMTEGIMVDDVLCRAEDARLLSQDGDSSMVEVVMTEGRKREVRHMLREVGHPVEYLARVAIGPISDKDLRPGQWRVLTPEEVRMLWDFPSADANDGGAEADKAPRAKRRAEATREERVRRMLEEPAEAGDPEEEPDLNVEPGEGGDDEERIWGDQDDLDELDGDEEDDDEGEETAQSLREKFLNRPRPEATPRSKRPRDVRVWVADEAQKGERGADAGPGGRERRAAGQGRDSSEYRKPRGPRPYRGDGPHRGESRGKRPHQAGLGLYGGRPRFEDSEDGGRRPRQGGYSGRARSDDREGGDRREFRGRPPYRGDHGESQGRPSYRGERSEGGEGRPFSGRRPYQGGQGGYGGRGRFENRKGDERRESRGRPPYRGDRGESQGRPSYRGERSEGGEGRPFSGRRPYQGGQGGYGGRGRFEDREGGERRESRGRPPFGGPRPSGGARPSRGKPGGFKSKFGGKPGAPGKGGKPREDGDQEW